MPRHYPPAAASARSEASGSRVIRTGCPNGPVIWGSIARSSPCRRRPPRSFPGRRCSAVRARPIRRSAKCRQDSGARALPRARNAHAPSSGSTRKGYRGSARHRKRSSRLFCHAARQSGDSAIQCDRLPAEVSLRRRLRRSSDGRKLRTTDRSTSMITIYHLETSRSERIVWLMEELALPYELQVFPRESTGAAPQPLKEIHALGKAPVIRDGDTILAESGAIVDYIVHRHGGGRLALPPADSAYARYVYWLHFAEGSLMSLLLIALVLSRVKEAAASPVTARMRERMKQMLSFVDTELAGGPWFAGEAFTA